LVLRPEAGLTTTGPDEETPDTSTCWTEKMAEPMVLARLLLYMGVAWTVVIVHCNAEPHEVVQRPTGNALFLTRLPSHSCRQWRKWRKLVTASREEDAAAQEEAEAARERAEEDRREFAGAMKGVETTLAAWREESTAAREEAASAKEDATAARERAQATEDALTASRADTAAAQEDAAAAKEDSAAAKERAEEDRREFAGAMEGVEAALAASREDNERMVR
ncbi:unnamed protein product, partial [Ectocarpus fasciculatus]